jgi:LPXTG-motif cell wall-anchored protein
MPYATAPMINPATGLPYPAIDPATGLPYGTPASDYTIPLVIGGLVVVGIGGYLFMRKSKSTPNRRHRRVRRNRRRSRRS